jgi:hypothetical protein
MNPLIQFPTPYQYRGLPCSIAPQEQIWCISGRDSQTCSTGVLEWCYNEQDALERLAIMKEHPRFENLNAHLRHDNTDKIHEMIFGEKPSNNT